MSDPTAGWYEDPSDPSRERWWGGQTWTDQTRPRGDSGFTGGAAPVDDVYTAPTTQVQPGSGAGWTPASGAPAQQPPAWAQPGGGGHDGGQPGPGAFGGGYGGEQPGAAYGGDPFTAGSGVTYGGPPPASGYGGAPSNAGYGGGQPGGQWPQQPIDTRWAGQQQPPATGHQSPYPPQPAPSGGLKVPWIIGGVVALLAVLGLLGLGLNYLTGESTAPTTTRPPTATTRRVPLPTTPSTSPTPSTTTSPTTDPNADPVEPTTRLSYKRLGPPWINNTGSGNPFGRATAGERVVTQQQTPAGGAYVAEVQLFPFEPPPPNATPATVAKQIADEFTAPSTGVYPDPHTRTDGESKAIQVSGRNAHLMKGRVAFDVTGYEAKGESWAVVVVDTPGGLGCVYISIPENRQDLLPVIDRVVSTLTLAP